VSAGATPPPSSALCRRGRRLLQRPQPLPSVCAASVKHRAAHALLAPHPHHRPPPPPRGNWLSDEEFHLALCHMLVGNQWSQHCNRLRGRTENSIKN
jgi:hypothetical protein